MADIEIWKNIKGYNGKYQVSNLGRVRSNAWGKTKIMNCTILPNGYSRVHINYKNNNKYLLVHRLVAEAFIPNPKNLPLVNHKSEIKTENFVENLEWCDEQYNSNYGTSRERTIKKIRKPIIQMDLDGRELFCWFSKSWAAEHANTNISNINRCLHGKNKTAGGFKWKSV